MVKKSSEVWNWTFNAGSEQEAIEKHVFEKPNDWKSLSAKEKYVTCNLW
jgi:hypothetical protein